MSDLNHAGTTVARHILHNALQLHLLGLHVDDVAVVLAPFHERALEVILLKQVVLHFGNDVAVSIVVRFFTAHAWRHTHACSHSTSNEQQPHTRRKSTPIKPPRKREWVFVCAARVGAQRFCDDVMTHRGRSCQTCDLATQSGHGDGFPGPAVPVGLGGGSPMRVSMLLWCECAYLLASFVS